MGGWNAVGVALGDREHVCALCAAMEQRGVLVSKVDSIECALSLVEGGRIDLVLFDCCSAQIDSVTTCERLRAAHAAMGIIAVATAAAHYQCAAVLDAGADEFLAEGVDTSESITRVFALLRRMDQQRDRGSSAEARVLRWQGIALRLTEHIAFNAHHPDGVALTPIQARLLAYLLQAGGAPVKHEQLWQAFGVRTRINYGGIRVHMHALRQRLRSLDVDVAAVRCVGYTISVSHPSSEPLRQINA